MWPEKNFPGYGTRWGALIFGKSGGGRSNFKILWLDHEIPNPIQIFLTKAGSTELGFRTLPESSNIFVGVTPPHLAATALTRIFGIRRRRACLGMPTDGGRRNTMWRCTNDRQRGCKMFMGLTTVEKQKIQTLKTQFQIISMFLMTFYSKKYLNVLGVHRFLSKTECYH